MGTVESCMHYITNISLEIDGDVAHGETYFFAVYRRRDSSQVEQDPVAATSINWNAETENGRSRCV